ncbi:MAG: hypothetical protein J7604_10400 [Sporocytophaga sp.]|uniref:hypothetical protein n=1 Tax=Sporocytophaga sp. TaxID=2231183 RepID=UPI001B0427D4|nr:hypothetical protein [Sporocytophaga sp.]MBO9700609.1 hypothetical protein [Sporocytophaga sp.]
MIYKFSILSTRLFTVLGITCGVLIFFTIGLFAMGSYIAGTLVTIAIISPFTLSYTCESNFNEGIFIFRIKYLFLNVSTETLKISDFDVYAYKKHTTSRQNYRGSVAYIHPNITLKVFNSKKRSKTIAIGYEPDVKKVIEMLKSNGYVWQKVIL